MDSITADFFTLLQSGLWSTKADLQTLPRWGTLWRLARQQTVAGVFFDAIGHLPEGLQPPRDLKLRMIAETTAIEQNNRRMGSVLREIAEKYDAHAIPYLLLKGSAVAATYPQPLHRVCGDIDFYLGRDHCFKAQKLLFANTSLPDHESRHFENRLHGIHIENHFRLAHSKVALYRSFESDLLSDAIRLPLTEVSVEGYPVKCPSPTFHALFMLEHMAFHLIGGLGLRQLCDWARFLYVHSERIDRDSAARIIRKYGFERIASVFTKICTDQLGMNPRFALIPARSGEEADRDAEYVLRLILDGGNFGKHYDTLHSSRKHLELPKPIRKVFSLYVLLRNRRKYGLISPTLWRKTLWITLIGRK